MAAVLGTLTNNPVGNSHRTQEKERSQQEFSTPTTQEVSLPVTPRVRLFLFLPIKFQRHIYLESHMFPTLSPLYLTI